MPVTLNGNTYFLIPEALEIIGVSRPTFYRWLKEGKIEDVKHRDRNGRRLLTKGDIERIKQFVEKVDIVTTK